MESKNINKILIVDFGSQVTQLIARQVRELGVYCELINFKKFNKIKILNKNIKGIILSGGPKSTLSKSAPNIKWKLFLNKLPLLGICYGHQLVANICGGKTKYSNKKEFGSAELIEKKKSKLTEGFFINKKNTVWMSHSDSVIIKPKNFNVIASSKNSKFAILESNSKKIFTTQFHPEVFHTKNGKKLFSNFLFKICKINKNWTEKYKLQKLIKEIKGNVSSNQKVMCALSGGVDSSVLAHLLYKAIKKNLICVYVDTGLMRQGETKEVINIFKKKFKKSFNVINAQKIFLNKLKIFLIQKKNVKLLGKLLLKYLKILLKIKKIFHFSLKERCILI